MPALKLPGLAQNVLLESDWICRKLARRWCETHALMRPYRRLKGEKSEWSRRCYANTKKTVNIANIKVTIPNRADKTA